MSLNLFPGLEKTLEPSGPLGKGLTVGQVTIALSSPSLIPTLNTIATANGGNSPGQLSGLISGVSLALLKREIDWISGASSSEWFSTKNGARAEADFNRRCNELESKYDRRVGNGGEGAGVGVVTIVVEIMGDETDFGGAGLSVEGTRSVLKDLAANAGVDGGRCLNGAEIFWVPGDGGEVISELDLMIDFPELIKL